MKITHFIFLCFMLSIGSCTQEKKNPHFESLSTLAGTWEMTFDGASVFEKWEQVNDTLYRGWSYEISDGDSVLTEELQLYVSGNEIYYVPLVVDQNDAAKVLFKLTSHEGDTFVFENQEHDFPTRIVYTFHQHKQLTATISGPVNGEMRSLEFDYMRIK